MTATVATAKRSAIAAGLVPATMTSLARMSEGEVPSVRIALGAGFVAVVLSLGAETRPELVQAFAWLIILGALLTNGYAFLRAVNRALDRSTPRSTPRKGTKK